MSYKTEQKALADRARMGFVHRSGKDEAGKIHKIGTTLYEVHSDGSYRRIGTARARELLPKV